MNEIPEWLASNPYFDPAAEWLPIVCAGGIDAHPVELIGAAQSAVHPLHGTRTIEIMRRPKDEKRSFIELSYADPGMQRIEQHHTTLTLSVFIDSLGSAVITCPSCTRVHRIARMDFAKLLTVSRESGLPWADVAVLD